MSKFKQIYLRKKMIKNKIKKILTAFSLGIMLSGGYYILPNTNLTYAIETVSNSNYTLKNMDNYKLIKTYRITNNSWKPVKDFRFRVIVGSKYDNSSYIVPVSEFKTNIGTITEDENGFQILEVHIPYMKGYKTFDINIERSFKTGIIQYDINKLKQEKDDYSNFKDYKKYISPSEKIESNNPLIKEKALELTKNLDSPYSKAQAIFNYVNLNMEYDFREGNKGALNALKTNKGVCEDYASLFVALCRASNIPARTIQGYRKMDNIDYNKKSPLNSLEHMWAEFYLPNSGWVIAEPTTSNYIGGKKSLAAFDFANQRNVAEHLFESYGNKVFNANYKYKGKKDAIDTRSEISVIKSTDNASVEKAIEKLENAKNEKTSLSIKEAENSIDLILDKEKKNEFLDELKEVKKKQIEKEKEQEQEEKNKEEKKEDELFFNALALLEKAKDSKTIEDVCAAQEYAKIHLTGNNKRYIYRKLNSIVYGNDKNELEDNYRKTKENVEKEAKIKAEQEAKEKAEQEAKQRAEQEAKQKAEQEAKEKAEREAKQRAEQEAKQKAEQEAKQKAEQEAKIKAEREAKERAEQKAKDVQIENTAFGLKITGIITDVKEISNDKFSITIGSKSYTMYNDIFIQKQTDINDSVLREYNVKDVDLIGKKAIIYTFKYQNNCVTNIIIQNHLDKKIALSKDGKVIKVSDSLLTLKVNMIYDIWEEAFVQYISDINKGKLIDKGIESIDTDDEIKIKLYKGKIINIIICNK